MTPFEQGYDFTIKLAMRPRMGAPMYAEGLRRQAIRDAVSGPPLFEDGWQAMQDAGMVGGAGLGGAALANPDFWQSPSPMTWWNDVTNAHKDNRIAGGLIGAGLAAGGLLHPKTRGLVREIDDIFGV